MNLSFFSYMCSGFLLFNTSSIVINSGNIITINRRLASQNVINTAFSNVTFVDVDDAVATAIVIITVAAAATAQVLVSSW